MLKIDREITSFNKQNLSILDFMDTLEEANVKYGDIICVHSDLIKFGKPLINNKKEYLNILIKILIDKIGETGTLIMPTFTYNYCNNEVYDIINSKSKVGILTEYFRNLEFVERTKDGIFSFAIYGKNKEYFLDIGNDCFGENSVFDKLKKTNAKLVLFGNRVKEFTFFHYIEQANNVPYRYMKRFRGKTKMKNIIYEDYFDYFVRDFDKRSRIDSNKIVNFLIDKEIFYESKIAYGSISSVRCDEFFNEASKKLNEQIDFFLKDD